MGLLYLFRLIFKKNIDKGVLVLTVCILGSIYYGFFYDFLFGLKVNDFLLGRHRYLYIFWDGAFLAFFLFIIFSKRNFSKMSQYFKFFSFFLSALSLVFLSVGIYGKIYNKDISQANLADKNENQPELKEGLRPIPLSAGLDKNTLPDIYYILPDQYANLSILRDYFNYDSKEFRTFLAERGFTIAEKSRSNYSITMFSLSSLLNMEYADKFGLGKEETSTDFSPLVELIQENRAKEFVKSLGYKYIYLSSDALVVGVKDTGEDIVESNLDTFMRQALKTTILRPFGGRYKLKEDKINKWTRNSVLKTFDSLVKIPTSNIEGPKFVFAHIMAPHGPYVFGPNGEEVETDFAATVDYEKDMELFLNQSIFVSRKIMETVDHILKNSKKPPVIIIQSDHGTWLDSKIVSEDLRGSIRSRNFAAYYLPGRDKKVVPSDVTMVNTFRLIFDQYLGTRLGFLKNRSYTYDGRYPYRFTEIVPDEKLGQKNSQ